MSTPRHKMHEVLCFSPPHTKITRSTVRNYYFRWREEHQLPMRCDEIDCQFHTIPLEWKGKPLKPIVDHVSGYSHDNTPRNLRLLCPNCDSQIDTRGGKNVSRIQNKSKSGYEVAHRDGKRDANVFPKGAGIAVRLGSVTTGPPHDEEA